MLRLLRNGAPAPFWQASAILGGLLCSTTVLAQSTTDPAAARVLFAEGRKLMAEARYAEACPKFEESLRLDSGIGAMFNLADCWEHRGRTASAWGMFLDTAAAARAANQDERMMVAKDRAAQLESKLSRMTIRLDQLEPGLEVRRDGQLLGRAAYETAVPVDPGTHRVEATATGKQPFSVVFEVAVGASVTVQIPRLESAEHDANAAPTGAPALAVTAADDAAAGSSHRRLLPYTLAGVGVAGLAVGVVLMIESRGKNSDALEICPASAACTRADIARHGDLISDAKRDQNLAIIGAGIGAASGIVAAILLATDRSPSASRSDRNWSIDFATGPKGGALLAKGRF